MCILTGRVPVDFWRKSKRAIGAGIESISCEVKLLWCVKRDCVLRVSCIFTGRVPVDCGDIIKVGKRCGCKERDLER